MPKKAVTADQSLLVKEIEKLAQERGVSDIYVRTSLPYLAYRQYGQWINEYGESFRGETREWIDQFDVMGDLIYYAGQVRTRASLVDYSSVGGEIAEKGMVMRVLSDKMISVDQIGFIETKLGLHPGGDLSTFLSWIKAKSGLVLVTGRTGAGKSTTLSAAVEYINARECKHILTLEEPVEYLYQKQKSVVTQIEVPTHEKTFAGGVRHALRRSPDIIIVGEINNSETALEALRAVETGHLVLSTLHTSNAIETMKRLKALIPPERQVWCAQVLSEGLLGIISQSLHFSKKNQASLLYEMLVANDQIKSLIRDDDLTGIKNTMFDYRAYPESSRPSKFIYEILENHGYMA